MKIAIIRRKFNPFGGAEKFIVRTIDGLKALSIQVFVISENWQANNEQTTSTTQWIKAKSSGINRAAKFLTFQHSVNNILKTNTFDLIQSHERLVGADIYRLGDGIHASWIHRQSQISSWAKRLWLKIDPYHRAVIRTEKAMAADSKLIYVANSTLVKQELMQWYGVSATRIELIENGIDISAFSPSTSQQKEYAKATLGLDNKRPTVVFVGSGFSRKGAFELLHAIKTLPDFQLIIVGYDKDLKKLKKLIDGKDLTSRVILAGPQKDVKPYLAAADVFCLPSLYDSFPNAVLEALCCGLPVIVTNAVGTAEAITNANAGIVCERNPSSIANALKQVIEQKQVMGQNALKLSENYDLVKISQQWLNLYQKLIKAKKRH